jgi:hypothetical protein
VVVENRVVSKFESHHSLHESEIRGNVVPMIAKGSLVVHINFILLPTESKNWTYQMKVGQSSTDSRFVLIPSDLFLAGINPNE